MKKITDFTANAVTITQALVKVAASTASLTKTGIGTLTLSGANTFNAPLTVAQGTLALPTLPNNALTVASGATLDTGENTVTDATFADGATDRKSVV